MKVEFEIYDKFTDYPDPKVKMASIISAFAKMLLVTMDETIHDVKIDGEGVYLD